MPTYRAEGIVIKRIDYSESDRILTLFTKNRGKISALAKGVKKPTSRKGGHIDLLNHSIFSIAEGRSLGIITEVETVDPFASIKNDLGKSSLGYYMAEFINEFAQERQVNYSLFRLFLMALGFLNEVEGEHGLLLVRSFELKALQVLGFAPEMRVCSICGEPLSWRSTNTFSPEAGGAVCARCSSKGGLALEPGSLRFLREISSYSWRKICRLDLKEIPINEAGILIQSYIEYILEKRLKSTELLEKIRSGNFATLVS